MGQSFVAQNALARGEGYFAFIRNLNCVFPVCGGVGRGMKQLVSLL